MLVETLVHPTPRNTNTSKSFLLWVRKWGRVSWCWTHHIIHIGNSTVHRSCGSHGPLPLGLGVFAKSDWGRGEVTGRRRGRQWAGQESDDVGGAGDGAGGGARWLTVGSGGGGAMPRLRFAGWRGFISNGCRGGWGRRETDGVGAPPRQWTLGGWGRKGWSEARGRRSRRRR
jgi:hypothetical protein